MRLDGLEAEREAARYLEASGLVILERRWRSRAGELDLVAKDGESIVFVEVKARASGAFGGPEAAVDGAKRRRVARAAQDYLCRGGLGEPPVRFDVVAVGPGGVTHIPDAFRP